jgi:phage shock protein PspC (stress-responsive transcriptional regulator)
VTETNRTETAREPDDDAYWPRPRRLADDRILGGVAAGLSAWLGVPVVALRLVFVIAALLNGIGLLAYAALWLALPLDGDLASEPRRLRVIGGAALGAIAALLVLERFDLPRSSILLPILLVGIGVALWQHSPNRRPRPPAQPDPSSVLPGAANRPDQTPALTTSSHPVLRGRRVRRPGSHSRAPRESWSPLARIGLALAFAALAIALLADRGDAVDLTLSRGASLLLVVLGAALIIGARYGHARSLTLLALPVAIFLPVASTFDSLDVDPFTHLGSRTYHVDGLASPLAPSYRNGIGRLTLDLTNIANDGITRRTELRNAIGSIEVFVPARVEVIVHARIGSGTLHVDDFRMDPEPRKVVPRPRLADESGRDVERTTTLPGEPDAGTIEIDAANGLGSIFVTRMPLRPDTEPRPAVTTTRAAPTAPATAAPATTTAPSATSAPASTAAASTIETR